MKLSPTHSWRRCLLPFLMAAATAQVTPSSPASASAPPVPYASVNELNLLLSQLEQTSQSAQVDLAKLRIERWKTDSNTKRGVLGDVESIQRNLQAALPEIISQSRKSPENLTATFKLYRNLNALYDVFGSVTESAGAFGGKDEYQALQNDLEALERSRRSLADRVETLSDAKEGEVTQLRTQLRAAQAVVIPPPPPTKVVVDDTEPPKKPVKKKATAKTTNPGASTTPQKPTASSSSPSQPQTQPAQTQPQ
jgi:hypothetical protein